MGSKSLSAAQRMGAYIRVRDNIMNGKLSEPNLGMCVQLGKMVPGVSWSDYSLLETFPEFALFCKPDASSVWFWWNDGDPIQSSVRRNEMRIFILQMCIEMIDKTNRINSQK